MGDQPQPPDPTQLSHAQTTLAARSGIMSVLGPSLEFGILAAGAGAFTGYAAAIGAGHKKAPLVVNTGFQWFCVGSTFWFTRMTVLRARGSTEDMSTADKTACSAFSGATAGATTGLFYGAKRIMPAVFVWGGIAALGQLAASYWESTPSLPAKRSDDDSVLRSSWSPLQKLNDKEYLDMVEERMLKVETEIALVDDRIAELRILQQTQQARARSSSEPGKSNP